MEKGDLNYILIWDVDESTINQTEIKNFKTNDFGMKTLPTPFGNMRLILNAEILHGVFKGIHACQKEFCLFKISKEIMEPIME